MMADIKPVYSRQTVNNGDFSENVASINREFQEKAAKKQAKSLGINYIDLSVIPINPDFLNIISYEQAAEAHAVVFYKKGNTIRLAADNPNMNSTEILVNSLKEKGFDVELNLASEASISEALNHYVKIQQYKKKEIIENVDEVAIQTFDKEIADLKTLPEKIKMVTAEEGLNLINIAAVKTGASDAHFEPWEKFVVVRFRIDGLLYEVFKLDNDTYLGLINQLKFFSKMTLNLSTVPQDGRYEFNFNNEIVAVRTASIPTPHGESFVCRYLRSTEKPLDFEELGFEGLNLVRVKNICEISHGMVLVSGPTGSGKSTTLYSILNKMKTANNKLVTLEDPVEYHIDGVTQSQIDEKHGYNFAGGLKSILRHDPDIVMLGEIRDLETAQVSVQAALTGHVLLSTVHTNSAIETIPRLINMGVEPFMVAPSIHTIIGQRLVRKICKKCSVLENLSESEKHEFEEVYENLKRVNPGFSGQIPDKIPRVRGCNECSNTGYKGRMVIVEMVVITDEIKRLIMKNSSTVDLIMAARKDGMCTMREDGFQKVAEGKTTLEEVFRATNIKI